MREWSSRLAWIIGGNEPPCCKNLRTVGSIPTLGGKNPRKIVDSLGLSCLMCHCCSVTFAEHARQSAGRIALGWTTVSNSVLQQLAKSALEQPSSASVRLHVNEALSPMATNIKDRALLEYLHSRSSFFFTVSKNCCIENGFANLRGGQFLKTKGGKSYETPQQRAWVFLHLSW